MAAEASVSARLQASGMGLIGLEQGALALQATLQPPMHRVLVESHFAVSQRLREARLEHEDLAPLRF